jgi:hypothetical protein
MSANPAPHIHNRHVKRLAGFLSRLDLGAVRLSKPNPFIFLCGGKLSPKENGADGAVNYISFRDYIVNRPVKAVIEYALAENAIDVFQYSKFLNLIDLEKQIAALSELIVVITESPGSFAELGAFSEIQVFRKKLFIITPAEHYRAPSFISLGPIKSLHDESEDKAASFVWTSEGVLAVDEDSNSPDDIAEAMNSRVAPQNEYLFEVDNSSHQMMFIYWISVMLKGVTITECHDLLKEIGVKLSKIDITRHLYCMTACGWMEFVSVGREIFVPLYDEDVMRYSYKEKDKENRGDADIVKNDILEIIVSEKRRNKTVLSVFGKNTLKGIVLDEIPEMDDIADE